MKRMLEVCCGSYEDAVNAWQGGARRIELNSALHLGGLTPGVASLELVRQHTGLTVISMVRPRAAGFCYNEMQISQLFAEAEELLRHGSDGLAFGFLKSDCTLDKELTARMVKLIKRYHKVAVFHRAFDCVNEPEAALCDLIELGVDRVLTSGKEATAPQGAVLLAKLQAKYGDKIEILAGSGINPGNVTALLEQTGLSQVHSSCKSWKKDSTTHNGTVSYAYAPDKYSDCYEVVDVQLVRELVARLG